MCGISGIIAFDSTGEKTLQHIHKAVDAQNKRGPDKQGVFIKNSVALGHNRLSIIDTSDAASQPFTDKSGRYTIVFNGEFFNYKEHRDKLLHNNIPLQSQSDTEVLLYLYISDGAKCLDKVNGFFAFAIYDHFEQTVFIARDRMGIKPLYYHFDNHRFVFASEIKSLLALDIEKQLDYTSLYCYLQLNYIPAEKSMLKGVYRLQPGNYIEIKIPYEIKFHKYYEIPFSDAKKTSGTVDFETAKKNIAHLLRQSVQKRLVSDVPLGAFLSGGVDSSVIVGLMSEFTSNINTFSIGFKDETFFDETRYAEVVANKFKTNHTVFSLTNNDLFSVLFDMLDYIDDPFADSSALAVYILSKNTRKHVTVALSGDGADELFGGYLKHRAEFRVRNSGLGSFLLKPLSPLLRIMPQSRNNFISNKIRQAYKFSHGLQLTASERYWLWCSITDSKNAAKCLIKDIDFQEFNNIKTLVTCHITPGGCMNEVFLSDMKHVLVNDMLVKVDMMSMANSLEVRVPFLDFEVVNYAFSLPDFYKIKKNTGKHIIQEAFKDILPNEIYHRPKHGFEVPLLKWFRNELNSMIHKDILADDFIISQNIFNVTETKKIKNRLQSNNPGDAAAQIWGLLVFQYWYKKYFNI